MKIKILVIFWREMLLRNEKGKIKSCLYEFPTEATKFLPYVIGSTVARDLRDKTLRNKLKRIKMMINKIINYLDLSYYS